MQNFGDKTSWKNVHLQDIEGDGEDKININLREKLRCRKADETFSELCPLTSFGTPTDEPLFPVTTE